MPFLHAGHRYRQCRSQQRECVMNNFDNGNGVNSRRPALFMMVNTLERGGTERQFVTMARALAECDFEVGLGCLVCRAEFVASLPGIRESPARGELFLPYSLDQ